MFFRNHLLAISKKNKEIEKMLKTPKFDEVYHTSYAQNLR